MVLRRAERTRDREAVARARSGENKKPPVRGEIPITEFAQRSAVAALQVRFLRYNESVFNC